MKMKNLLPDFFSHIINLFSPYRQEVTFASLGAVMAFLRGAYVGNPLGKRLIDAVMCSILAWFSRDLIMLTPLPESGAFILSVFIGFLGVEYLTALIKKIASKVTGSEVA